MGLRAEAWALVALAVVVGSGCPKRKQDPLPALMQRAESTDPDLRRISAARLGDLGDRRGVATLIALANGDPDKTVRAQALHSLGRIDDERALQMLFETADQSDDSKQVGWAVVGLSLQPQDRSIPLLIELFRCEHFLWNPHNEHRPRGATVVAAANTALVQMGEPAQAALVRALEDPHPGVRSKAADTLGDMRASAARARLVALTEDPEPAVQAAARSALERIDAPRPTATP